MVFGQLVVGPPGSGKSTFCYGMQQFMQALNRKVVVVNLDPANDCAQYECKVDVRDLVSVEDVMEELKLGPNGGMVYAIEFLEKNMDWLHQQLKPLMDSHHYFLFDCPGQVELYTHHPALKAISKHMQDAWHFRLAAVHLVDSHYCSDPAKFLSALLVSLSSMVSLELPFINVLSKIDLVETAGRLPFSLEFFTELDNLPQLLLCFQDSSPHAARYKQLNEAIVELLEDYGVAGFHALNISDKDTVGALLDEIDKANGYVFRMVEESGASVLQVAAQSNFHHSVQDIEEKYMSMGGNESEEDSE